MILILGSVICLAAGSAPGVAALFEETLAVKVPRGLYGPRSMPGDIIELKDGTLLMAYTQNAIMGIKSADRGRNWAEPFVVLASPKAPATGRVAHPGFLRLKNGEILLSYIYTTHPATPYYGHNYYRRSADEGKTWSDQFIMTPHSGYVLVHNDRLITLKSGRILAPAEYKAYEPSSHDHNGYVGLAFYSDDLGQSWWPSKNVVDLMPVEVQEAHAVELKDGRVMMFARSYSGHPVRAYSNDGGQTWSKGELIKELNMPCAGLPTVTRIPSTGDLLFIWISEQCPDQTNPKVHRRCALTSAVSQDEGRTFVHLRNIASGPDEDFGYQSVDFLKENVAVISYHCRDGLRVARIGFNWFYGK